jgi:uncharacterized protein with HEPN domain
VTAPRDYRDFLHDLAEACKSIIRFSIIRFAEGMTLDAYLADEKTRYAVMRGYEIIGEAVRHLPEGVKTSNPDIPWAAWPPCAIVSFTVISGSTTRSFSQRSTLN